MDRTEIYLNGVIYQAEQVNFLLTEKKTKPLLRDELYLGNITMLNPDKTIQTVADSIPNEKGTWLPVISKGTTQGSFNTSDAKFTLIDDLLYYSIHLTEITTANVGGDLNITLPSGFEALDFGSSTVHLFSVGATGSLSPADADLTMRATLNKLYVKDTKGRVVNPVFNPAGNALMISGVIKVQKTI